jgi:flavorubredoxin
MNKSFQPTKISDSVWWVGAIDRLISDFHGYGTPSGTSYNAYLVMGEKVVLIDTVKKGFEDELISRISSVIDPSRIDYIISNHAEMDHSGSLPYVIDQIHPEKIFASAKGVETLRAQLPIEHDIEILKTGDSLSLGNKELSFMETRMLHWPDSMFTYFADEGVLFSQDAFGMHLASYERFDDQIPESVLEWEATKYYGNILMPFSPLVINLLKKVGEMDLNLKLIAPDHGPIWRNKMGWILDLYRDFALQKPTNRVVVLFDTMWGSTTKMAKAIAEGVESEGGDPRLIPLSVSDRSVVATEVLKAGALIVGSPTMNREIFPSLADVMIYLKGLKPKNLIGASFGSYGWSGEAHKNLDQMLKEMKVDIVHDPISAKWVPTDEKLMECFELGVSTANRLSEE